MATALAIRSIDEQRQQIHGRQGIDQPEHPRNLQLHREGQTADDEAAA